MIVADASALLELLLGSTRGRAVEAHLLDSDEGVQAPALVDAEVAQALRRMVAAGTLQEPHGRARLEILGDMPLHRHLLTPLLPRIWQLRDKLTAYDAAYVALAEALECPLLTFDRRIADAPGHTAEVVVPES